MRGRTGIITPQTIRGRPGYFLDDGRNWIYMWAEQGCTYFASSRYLVSDGLSKDELLVMAESAAPLEPTARTADNLGPCEPPTYLPSTCDDQAYRPKTVLVSCGDGNFILTRMRWSGWGSKTASGKGTAKLNQCRPNCAKGRFRKYPVTALLSGRTVCPDFSVQYTRLRYRFSRSSGVRPRTGSVPFNCP